MERRRAAEEQRLLADVLEAEAEAHRQAIRAASEEDERCRKAGGGVVNMLLAAL
ncbi:MAG: hypothetical protein ACK460_22815 [Microcystis sp.]|uniref:hypothetical protein n=1 Tax=Microcystis sp. TaxID=1127 RepID=UPI00391B8312